MPPSMAAARYIGGDGAQRVERRDVGARRGSSAARRAAETKFSAYTLLTTFFLKKRILNIIVV